MKNFGKELILDIHECDASTFNRKSIKQYFIELCELIDMERCKLSWWDYYGVPQEEWLTEPHLIGTSAVQFIMTSNITIHTLDLFSAVYINIFSCKEFEPDVAKKFTAHWFKGKIVSAHIIDRI